MSSEAARARDARYRAAHREELRARYRARVANMSPAQLEARRAYARNRYRDNPEVREREKQLRIANRERNRQYQIKWREANRGKLRSQGRDRYKNNAARERADAMRFRHSGLTPEAWAALWVAQNGCCYLCGEQLDAGAAWHEIHVDHDHRCCPKGRSCSQCRRGLSHGACNTLIGLADDDPERLRRIADNLAAAKARVKVRGDQLALFGAIPQQRSRR